MDKENLTFEKGEKIMKYKLIYPFASISGVIERRYDHDGAVRTLIARKNGTMCWRKTYPRRRQLGCRREMVP